MAVINKYKFSTEEVITPIILGASDTVQVTLTSSSSLFVQNDTGGPLTVNVLGDTATEFNCPGVGFIDLTGGKDFTVADGELYKFPLNTTYKEWLGDGNLTITGGDLATAYVLEV